jgi:hypothetical protein
LPKALVDALAKFAQIIGSEAGLAGADRHNKVRLQNIRPLDRKRSQSALGAGVRHAVATPVVAHREQIKRLPTQRMEWVSDGKNLCAVLVTICNARSTPKPRWK